MPKLKPGTIWPTPEEDAEITRGALADPDNPPMSDDEMREFMKTAVVGDPLDNPRSRRGGRVLGSGSKKQVTMSLDADLLAILRASGPGWQTRANDALRRWARRSLPHA